MTDETEIAKALVEGVMPLLYMTSALRGRDEVRSKLEGWAACIVKDARNEAIDACIAELGQMKLEDARRLAERIKSLRAPHPSESESDPPVKP